MTDYQWRPIEDLPENWQKLASSEMTGLFAVWKEQVGRLKDSPAYLEFQARLRREWAIETGIIEGLYDINRGVTRTLIEHGLHASLIAHGDANKPAEEIIPMLKDHETVVEGLFDFVGQQRSLSTSYIKQVHQALTAHQDTAKGIDSLGRIIQIPLRRGDWKNRPNNPTREDGKVHEYCPPEQVSSEMDHLIEIYQRHLQVDVPPEVEAAWLHHRFTQIHPFQDGNGRVARALASLVFLRAGWFPLVVHRDDRNVYIESLEFADRGDVAPLVRLFSRIQKRAFNQALRLSEQTMLDVDPLERIITEAAEHLLSRRIATGTRFELPEQLKSFAMAKMSAIASKITTELGKIDPRYSVAIETNNPRNDSLLNPQVSEVASRLGYHANTSSYASWLRIIISEEKQTILSLSLHTSGAALLDLFAASAWIEFGNAPLNIQPISKEVFQFSSQEPEQSVKERFESWLDKVILNGLTLWRERI